MRRGSGLANWDIFSAAVRAVVDPYLHKFKRVPGRRVMVRLGHQRLISASYNHHDGWASDIQQLGYPSELAPQNTAHLEPGVGRGRQRGPLADWEICLAVLREAVTAFRKKYRRNPTQDELIQFGYRPVVQALHRHHHGVRHAMRILKFRRKRRPRRCPSGLNIWETFASQALPVWSSFIDQHQRLPSKRELLGLGYGELVYAANKYHNGLSAVHVRLGFASIPKPRRRRRPKFDWSKPTIRQLFLEQHFPGLVSWGIAPTRALARHHCSGLVSYSQQYPGKWPALMEDHGLLSHRDGTYQRHRAEVVCWALDQYERLGRWPNHESGPHVGIVEYPRSAEKWLELTALVTYHPCVLLALIERWKRHLLWIRQHQPSLESMRQQRLNKLIIASNLLTPSRLVP